MATNGGAAIPSPPQAGGAASTAAAPPKAPGAPSVLQGPPDMAVQIMRRLELLEQENRRMRDQLALHESQRNMIPEREEGYPPPPAPHPAPRPVREQGTVDTRVLGKPVNGVKDEQQWPVFSRRTKFG